MKLKEPFKSIFAKGPAKWRKKGLELPRLEIHLTALPSAEMMAVCYLVKRHFMDAIEAVPMAAQYGSPRTDYFDSLTGGLYVPNRLGVDARHDAKALKLPLYVTSEKGDHAEMDVATGTQTFVRRARVRR